MDKLIECIPNFSEGRRPEVIQALADAVREHEPSGIRLLDVLPDVDHNRVVVTFLGPPEAVVDAALQSCRVASELIDLRAHHGSHPRIGATDVIPLVPLRGLPMAECVEWARRLGSRIAHELEIPVYLYEEAAVRPERRSLVEIRRGQYEGLRADIEQDPGRAPDIGPPRLHPSAGAVVVGARWPLIAYNVNLATTNLAVAKDIARAVRESSGGLPCVRAIGLSLVERGLTQVSMNLTNYRVTPIQAAFEAVRREAAGRGVEVLESEIVGLVPAEALGAVAAHYLKVTSLGTDQLLESHF